MGEKDLTQIGGGDRRFHTTQWTEVLAGRDGGEPGRDARAALLGRYWKPIYCYLRRKGYDNEAAKDLTQGFFAEVVLGRDMLARVDRAKGRFRTFLLSGLECYLADEHRKARAAKRRPDGPLLSLDAAGELPEPAEHRTPEQAFHHQWAADLVDDVLAEVEASCRAAGRQTHWLVFAARVVEPILLGREPQPLAALCEQHGLAGEKEAANMTVTVKRLFARTMRERVRQWVASEEEVEQEIQDLLEILSRRGAAQPPGPRMVE